MKKWIALTLLLVGCDEGINESTLMTSDVAVADSAAADVTAESLTDVATMADLRRPNDQLSPRPMDAGISVPDTTSPMDGSTESDMMDQPTAPIIWTGPKLTFEKSDGADPESPEAQDRVTESVVLTRGDGNVLFNIVVEDNANAAVSPRGTLWSMGTTETLESLEFVPLREAANNRMRDLPGKDMVLFLVEENIYIDVRFISWRSGRGRGGGFSYTRSTSNTSP